MAQTHDHEIVSIYPFSDDEVDQMMPHSAECVDAGNQRRLAGRRHPRLCLSRGQNLADVCESPPPRSSDSSRQSCLRCGEFCRLSREQRRGTARGGITFKGPGEFFEDDETKQWFYTALSTKLNPDNPAGQQAFYGILDSPLRTILAMTPVKKIMYNGALAGRHIAGTAKEDELGERLSSDAERMNRERAERGLEPR